MAFSEREIQMDNDCNLERVGDSYCLRKGGLSPFFGASLSSF